MVLVSYLVYYYILFQNATDVITKCDSYFITKWDKSLLQNTSGCLLRNVKVSLQIAMVITKCIDLITKCVIYYKLGHLLQNASVHFSTERSMTLILWFLPRTLHPITPWLNKVWRSLFLSDIITDSIFILN